MESRRDVSGWHVRWDDERARDFIAQGIWPEKTVADFAEERAEAHPDRVQIVDGDRNLTCRALVNEARCLARALKGRGLKPGQVVSFQLPNWYEATVVNLAAAMAGLVLNPVVSIYRDAEVGFILDDAGSRMIFIPESYRDFSYPEMMMRLRASWDSPLDVVVVRGDPGPFVAYEDLLAEGHADGPLPSVDPNAIKLIMYTSGTTGRAKGVLHTHNTIHAENWKTATKLGLESGDSTFNPSPVTHITGAIYALNLPWFRDIKTVLQDTWDADRAFDLLKSHRCTFSAGATPFLKGLVDVAERRGMTLTDLTIYMCGGASVPPSLIYKAAEVFPNCIPYRTYGMTEAPVLTYGPESRENVAQGAETDGEIWLSNVKVVDIKTGAPLPMGEVGEFLVRTPNMALGYARPEDNDAAYDEEGYFRTGDLGRLLDGGRCLEVTDRKKDLIIRAGENISAREIEETLLGHPSVADIAVVAMSNDVTGESVCAFLSFRDGESAGFADLVAFLGDAGLAKQKAPERMVEMDQLPRTSTGKIRKDQLRDLARGLSPDRTLTGLP